MTRHSPSEAVLGENPVAGLHANFTLLSAFNDAVGKEVLLELIDGSVFTGIFGGASSEMEVGLYCAYEKTPENEANLIPLKKDILQKRQFAFSDIVCVTVPTNDEKMIRGFATDRDYHNKRRAFDDDGDHLEEWEEDEEDMKRGPDMDLEMDEGKPATKAAATAARNGGWGVNEMFAANQTLGVKTTFNDNLSQYTTAEVEGTEEDRRRADEIARQIEKSGSSRMYSALENDDEERDLDKITQENELLGYESRNKNGGGGGGTLTPSTVVNQPANVATATTTTSVSSSPRPPSLMTTTPPGFMPVIHGKRKNNASATNEHSHNTYLPLANRGGMNGRGGSQMASKNMRAEGLKGGEPRRGAMAGGGGGPPSRGGATSLAANSPKGQGPQQGGGTAYAKRDSYDGQNSYDTWTTKGSAKSLEKPRGEQKMLLENRSTASSQSPRGAGHAGGAPSAPPNLHGEKGSEASGRVEGLKAWQKDFNPSYRETRPSPHNQQQKDPQQQQHESQSSGGPQPLLESLPPPTKNAWQSGPPSGLTSAAASHSRSEDKGLPSPSVPLAGAAAPPTPAEMKFAESREMREDGASTSRVEGERRNEDTSVGGGGGGKNETEDSDTSKDSNGKKFSFNPDAPAFTPKMGGGGMGMGGMGGGGMPTAMPPQASLMMTQPGVVPLLPTLMPAQAMPMQGQMGGMGGMQQPTLVYPYPSQSAPHYANMQQNIQYSAVVNGGSIMAGAAQNGGGGGGAPPTPRPNGGGGGPQSAGGPGAGGTQRPRPLPPNASGGGPMPLNMGGGAAMYMQPVSAYPNTAPMHTQPTFMPQQGNYYQYPVQAQMIQGAYAMPMTMQQQGMMGQPQRSYIPAAPNGPPGPSGPNQHQGMMMQYGGQQYGGGGGGPMPPGNNQGGGGGGGVTPSASTTNGGGGGGGGQNGQHQQQPPSQPPTPGAGQQQQQQQSGGGGGGGQGGGAVPPQGTIMSASAAGPSPSMYGMYGGGGGGGQGGGVVYYGGGGGGGGPEMMHSHEGAGGGGGEMAASMHMPMQHYHYNPGQYYQSAPPHLMRTTYSGMAPNMGGAGGHGMPQQQQPLQHAPVPPSQSQN